MVVTDRVLQALGAAHEGAVGVLLADGSEPGPVYFDVGSGPSLPSSTEWHAYDGRFGRPRAALLRGTCSCGWRAMAEYPLDWTTEPLYEADVDLSGPVADYDAHLSAIRDAAVQLPPDLTGLLTELVRQLDGLATEKPQGPRRAAAPAECTRPRGLPGVTACLWGGRRVACPVATGRAGRGEPPCPC